MGRQYKLTAMLAGGALLAVTGSVLAHHSFAMFDQENPIDLSGAVQEFNRGMMIYAGPVLKKIFVFFSDNGYGSYDVNRWAVYDDTFSEP